MIYLVFLIILAIITIIRLLYQKKARLMKDLIKLPGPKPNIIFGNTLDLIGPTDKLVVAFSNYFKTYGETFVFHDGPLSVGLITVEYELIKFILSSPSLITKADQYVFLKNWLGQGLITSTGQKWQKHRKALTPAFHFSILKEFISTFESVSEVLLKKIESCCEQKSVDITSIISVYTLDVICEAAMGISVKAQEDSNCPYVKGINTITKIMVERAKSPIHPLFYPLTPNFFLERRALKVTQSFVEAVVDERIKELENKKEADFFSKKKLAFLDLLLHSKIDNQPLSKTDIMDEVNTFMFAGYDTVSASLSFTLYLLANHPDVQENVLKEQEELFGKDFKHSKLSYEDLQNMEYLNLVIKESLRLYPSVPAMGRVVDNDFEHNGVVCPKGLNIMIPSMRVMRNEKYFPNPSKFDPERFRDELNFKHPFSYIPFSAGPRNCIGQRFAMLEMKATVSKIIRNFELLPAIPAHKPRIAPESKLVSKNGVRIAFRKR